MSRRLGIGLLLAPLALAAAGCASGSGSTATTTGTAVGCSTTGAAATATTASYRFVLDVGPVQEMYAPSYVKSHHPTSGEVMLGGSMTTASGPDARHLEVHICQLANHHVVQGANPGLELTDTTTGSAQAVPVSTMEGVGAGLADLHYGNNVVLVPGHDYALTVTLAGQRATLRFIAPAVAAAGTTSTTGMGSMKMASTTTTMKPTGGTTTTTTKAGSTTSTTGMGSMKMGSTTTTMKPTSTTARAYPG